jgi:proton-translocating NAD(P)+ transhydrogenase subunit alpha
MKVGVPNEDREGERRVALVPDVVKRLGRAEIEAVVERGAGERAGFTDQDFEEAGATLGSADDVLAADVVARVSVPTPEEIEHLRKGSVLIGFLAPLTAPETSRALASRGVTALAMESIPRITRAQSMDALSSQSTVSGYKAALIAAEEATRFFPMLTTAAGTVRPAKVLVLGAGVAGLQAIATARRLGALVTAYDVRAAVKEQIESLGATFLELELEADAEGEGGYAKEMDEAAQQRQRELLAEAAGGFDAAIATALIPGRPAPVLLTADAVRNMRPGSVIVDLAGEAGGNCELTEPGKTVVREGVKIIAPPNLPATLPDHASQLYARNVQSLLELLVDEGQLKLDFEDEIVKGATITHEGEIVNERAAAVAGAPAKG